MLYDQMTNISMWGPTEPDLSNYADSDNSAYEPEMLRFSVRSDKPMNIVQFVRWAILLYSTTTELLRGCTPEDNCTISIYSIMKGALQYAVLLGLGYYLQRCRGSKYRWFCGAIALTLFTGFVNQPWSNPIYLTLTILDLTKSACQYFEVLGYNGNMNEHWQFEFNFKWYYPVDD
ncbi:hypothetical protein H072_6022 [Dactylellina haptotyla CBS 200.50]|uniref:Uncharacterized protein n=1 Tax=Dactylellina haptotyla (strain CBS 200.50) TaxID=1284197 RepID=S8AG57_DACHA|nr:hypothetical protein H072_6022 [Dactylellina haptotyla CBS 200.50]